MPLFLKRKKNLITLSLLIFFQLILISIQVPIGEKSNFLEKMIFSVFAPIQHGVISFFQKTGDGWKGHFALRGVNKENKSLKEENFVLSQENDLLRSILTKYKNEKELEETFKQIHENIITARVIGIDPSNIHRSITINRGSRDGISIDKAIVDRSGFLVGRISGPVALKQARVQLITDIDAGVSVLVEDTQLIGILAGDAAGLCRLNYILNTEVSPEIGTKVITNGYDGIYPPGIPVGSIIKIEDTDKLFKNIYIKPHFSLADLDRIAVVGLDANDFY